MTGLSVWSVVSYHGIHTRTRWLYAPSFRSQWYQIPWCAYPKGVGNVIIKAGCVHIIKDFLPAAVAMRMHAELLEAWQRTYNGTRDDFYFTTNCKLLRSYGLRSIYAI